MIDREKVIKGLECWTDPNPYITTVDCMLKNCPYAGNDHCDLEIFNGALELLKEQELSMLDDLLKARESRILTLDEVKILPAEADVWIHHAGKYNSDVIHACTVYEVTTTEITFWYGYSFEFKDYGKRPYGWICWTSRPTDEQQKAAKWDDI